MVICDQTMFTDIDPMFKTKEIRHFLFGTLTEPHFSQKLATEIATYRVLL